jgi:hypothetical protein
MDKPIVMVAGMPRTGSMWTYNVARRLIRAAGHTPWPVHIPPDPIPVFRQAMQFGIAASDVICIKVHSRFEGAVPGLKVLCNLRDIRDVIVSYMRFMHVDFDEVITGFEDSMALTDYYFQEARFDVLDVRYENIMLRAAETVTRIGFFLGFQVSPQQAEEIAGDYSRKKLRSYIAKLGDAGPDGETRKPGQTQRNADGSVRFYDHTTGFQSGHVSDSQGGEWRTLLDASQQARLLALTGDWLARYGYARQ